ncbi:hypothetical protein N7447_007975 [Penicillium robsamsonii]|uniref:uncharacterized protein n=1 Tax=Penicillium robsamsonii TaxID=1792511 RepID=UPI0025483AEB|nr:uncharacterized protein N7447_007975 [Penicillium robsamsonii]KAJ5817967.1 hypothetical protein N7447_007975 [Penicillium robsamsonii]
MNKFGSSSCKSQDHHARGDKKGNDILGGDSVYTKFREAGRMRARVLRGNLTRQQVESIVKDQASARHEGVASYKASTTSARQGVSLLLEIIPMVSQVAAQVYSVSLANPTIGASSSTPISMATGSLIIRAL